jgi:hypothetical protein
MNEWMNEWMNSQHSQTCQTVENSLRSSNLSFLSICSVSLLKINCAGISETRNVCAPTLSYHQLDPIQFKNQLCNATNYWIQQEWDSQRSKLKSRQSILLDVGEWVMNPQLNNNTVMDWAQQHCANLFIVWTISTLSQRMEQYSNSVYETRGRPCFIGLE